jgi:ATP-dependent RNA helicase DeaD
MGIPTQMESYIHRSGRTGRAGLKGASLALVNFKESRILLAWSRRGGLKLDWRALPTQAEIRETRARKLAERIQAVDSPRHLELARRMLEQREAPELVAALLSLVEGSSPDGYDIPDSPKQEYSTEKRPFKPRPGEKSGWTPGQKAPFRPKPWADKAAGPKKPYAPKRKWDTAAPAFPKKRGQD